VPESLLVQLIMLSGKWGVAFARNLIQSEWATIGQKISAVSALVGLGELPGGRSVEIIHNNRPMSILASKPSVSRACEDVGTLLDRAVELHKQGHDREVCDIITELIKIGVDHPPVMTMLARSLTNLGREREAQLVIEQMEDEHPGDPMVYLNLSAFYLENGDIANALSYFELLKECDVPSELSELVADVEEAIAAQLHSLIVSQKIEADYCGEKDNLDISLNLTLRQALKHIPVDWLNAIASQYKLEPVPRRREREKALACKMLVPESLIRALREERAEVRKALAQILASGGHHDSSALIERYGSIDDDGFYWVDKPPKSVIGRLRLLGFVYIGRAVLDAEERQVAVVPVDLRKMLSRILT